MDCQACGMHFRGIGFDGDVSCAAVVEHLGEVARPTADVEHGAALQLLTRQAEEEVTDEFDGIVGESAVEDVRRGLFVAEVA